MASFYGDSSVAHFITLTSITNLAPPLSTNTIITATPASTTTAMTSTSPQKLSKITTII